MYISTVTRQGQISIPAKLRRELDIDKKKVWVSEEQGRIIIEPVVDLLDLAGSLKHKNIKGKSIDEIIALEKKTIEEGYLERAKRSLVK